jgi:hypothetical protein
VTRPLTLTLWAVLLMGALAAPSANAGNIALTGHDDDHHSSGFPGLALTQLGQLVQFARAGSSIPTAKVLAFDGPFDDDLRLSLTALGIPHDAVTSAAGVPGASFDPTVYSAFVVASHVSCGGCSNDTPMMTALAARKADIATFFNGGGGIAAFSGASIAATYYNFLPQSAAGFGSPPSSPYFAAVPPCFGTVITPVNGDPTHNFFPEPGTGGVSSLYCVAERFGNATTGTAVTLLLQGGLIVTDIIVTTTPTTTGGVPEPVTLTMLGLGLVGAAYQYRRRRA